MKKILIAALFIAAFGFIAIYFFTPKEKSKEDMLDALTEKQSSYNAVADYFIKHTDIDPKYVYEQDADNYPGIENAVKEALDDGFLYIGVSSDHREITFGTAAQGTSEDHKLIYSPYDMPSSAPDAEATKFGGWYIKM